MKNIKNKLFLFISILTPVIVVSSYNACSKYGFENFTVSPQQSSTTAFDQALEGKNTLDVSFLSAEQILRSVESLTGVIADSNVIKEYNARNSILASGFDFKMMTSPMWLEITNISFTACKALVNKEAATGAVRDFFPGVNISSNNNTASTLSIDMLNTAINNMAYKFWGRMPSSTEMSMLLTAKDEAIAANTSENSNDLLSFLCTGMLSSYDSLQL